MAYKQVFLGNGVCLDGGPVIPPPPTWRAFGRKVGPLPSTKELDAADVQPPPPSPQHEPLARIEDKKVIWTMNAALLLRRPMLIAGPPGAGKTTLAKLIANELGLGPVLRWPITSSTRLQDGLYHYDAISWVQDQNRSKRDAGTPAERIDAARRIGRYIRLGPVGTALLPWRRPRVLLIDEIDKADIDLPNDLLHIFEEGQFEIPELFRLDDAIRKEVPVYTSDSGRLGADGRVDVTTRVIRDGVVRCFEFPVVVLTSNGERSFPPAFLRRCLRLDIDVPVESQLRQIIKRRIIDPNGEVVDRSIKTFLEAIGRRDTVAVDQLLNAVYLLSGPNPPSKVMQDEILEAMMARLDD